MDATRLRVEGLSDGERRWADEYLLDCNVRAASIRAGYSPEGGVSMLKRDRVLAYVRKKQAERAARLELTADNVMGLLWSIASADPNDLTSIEVKACRHCYGLDFCYQWKDEVEFAQFVEAELKRASKEARLPILPPMPEVWYDWRAAPNPLCPRCEGRGDAHVHVRDTRNLKGKARFLYGGVKEGKDGKLEIVYRSQDAALAQVAKYFGLTPETLNLNGGGMGSMDLSKLTDDEFTQLSAIMDKLGGVIENEPSTGTDLVSGQVQLPDVPGGN